MMQHRTHLIVCALALGTLAQRANAAEICGNGIDDDADGYADEGCFSNAVMGVCESPLACSLTGDIGPKTGYLVYQLAPDIAPVVPYGPNLAFKRTYMSGYAPPATNYRTALGSRWQHNWQSWLDKSGTSVIVHLVSGEDVKFTFSVTNLGYDYYAAQAGFHMKWLRQSTTSPNHWELRTLTGETYEYDWSSPVGKLVSVWDSDATPNKVTLAYKTSGTDTGQLDTVTDASGHKRLQFAYTSGVVTSVNYQTGSGSTWTTRVTLGLSYSGGSPISASLGGTTFQTYGYTSNYLTSIVDASSNHLADFRYVAANAGQIASVGVGEGNIGFDYNSSNSQCTGNTVLFSNLANTTSCNVDGDCGGTYKCGGKTGSGVTGKCYRAARCLTVTSPSEDLITNVSAITPCTGSCAPSTQYSWNTTTLDLKGIKLADNNWTSYQRNSDGMVVMSAAGDSDDDPTNGGGIATWFAYANTSFPGRLTQRWTVSNLSGVGTCSGSTTTGCKVTQYVWNADGQLQTQTEAGFTLNGTSTPVGYTYTTTFTYETGVGTFGRLLTIDGPLSGTDDSTQYTYWSSSDVLKDGYINLMKREVTPAGFGPAVYQTTTSDGYDYFGNAGTTIDPDGTYTCKTFDSNRNYLTQQREAMAGQTDCTTVNGADLTTSYVRDSALRLTKTTHPLTDCEHREYDAMGRLQFTKLRDDCVATNAGNTNASTYDTNGLKFKVEYQDASSAVTKRQVWSYLDAQQIDSVTNPVSTSYSKSFTYYSDGPQDVTTFENGIGKTERFWDAENRETTRHRFLTATDTTNNWTFAYPMSGGTSSPLFETVTDPASKSTTTTYDDMGRKVKVVSPDEITEYSIYDAGNRLTTLKNDSVTHTFTYDLIGRVLTEDYGTESCSGSNPVEVQYAYDALPSGISCPTGASCTNLVGHVAYVKQVLMCTSTTPFHLDQQTFYGYDAAGRLISEEVDDPSPRSALQLYTWDKNGNLTSVKAPSGASATYTFGGTGNSDSNLATKLTRVVSGSPNTDLVTNIQWAPFGPVMQYDEAATIGGSALRATLSWNLAYRASSIDYSTVSGTTHKTHIAYTEDPKGRYTQKLYTNVDPGIKDDYLQYDWFDRLTCDATVSGTCPTSGTTLKTNVTAYNSSNDRSTFNHQDATFGDFGYTVAYNTGADKVASVTWNSRATSLSWSPLGMRTSEDDPNSTVDRRDYTYDGKHRVRTVTLDWARHSVFCRPCWDTVTITYAYDYRDRVVFRDWHDPTANIESQTFFYWDMQDRLIESKFVPSAGGTNYTLYDFYWLGRRPVAMWAVDQSGTTSRYFLHADESNRVLEMYSWPSSGDATEVWALNPEAFGWDSIVTGGSLYQPLRMDSWLYDDGTWPASSDGVWDRPPLYLRNGIAYDALAETTLQRTGNWPNEPYAVANHQPATEGALNPLIPSSVANFAPRPPGKYVTFYNDEMPPLGQLSQDLVGSSQCIPGPQYDETQCSQCVEACAWQGGKDNPTGDSWLRCYLAGPFTPCIYSSGEDIEYYSFMNTCKRLWCGANASEYQGGSGSPLAPYEFSGAVCDEECPSQTRTPSRPWDAVFGTPIEMDEPAGTHLVPGFGD